MNAEIREGTAEDLAAALGLIKELAEYERSAGEVEVTVEQMREWAFGKEKIFSFFVLSISGRICGLALYYYKYSTWKGRCLFLEDLIVTDSERRKGYGKLLFDAVLQVARKEKVKRVEWQVLSWNEPAITFYRQYNSRIDSEWLSCRLTEEQLQLL